MFTKGIRRLGTGLTLAALLSAPAALADNWTINITVDNQYDVYFGHSMATTFAAGGDTVWSTTETWNATGQPANAFLYVSTASDHSVAQGFLAEFQNTTQSVTILTGSPVWEVFPAGKFLQLIDPSWPATWPPMVMPTQAQVDAAIAFATTNNLWVTPTTVAGYANSSSPAPWGTRPGIAGAAQWIWYDSGNDTSTTGYPIPFRGFNHDEFLIFRVPNVPEPASLALLSLGGLVALARGRTRRA